MIFKQKTIILILILISYSGFLKAQSSYAIKTVDTLSSPYFWGRGYAKNGIGKAAHFIAEEMIKIGLQPLSENFFQSFYISTNTFEKSVYLKINGRLLKVGKDFIVKASSPALKGKFKLNKIDEKNYKDPKNKISITKTNKLTWSPASQLDSIVQIYLKDTSNMDLTKAKINLKQEFKKDFEVKNVCGFITGTVYPDSFLVLTAHYDHLGGLGKHTYFPGANDNASGTALLLELAGYYVLHPPKYSVAFLAFGAEEIGLKGSKYFVEHPLISLEKIKFLLNLDLMGNGKEGITVVNASGHPNQFQSLVAWNKTKGRFKDIKFRENAANSDHYPFTQKGVPAFFIYTLGGNPAYHDIYDISKTLTLKYFPDLELMIQDFFNTF